MIRIVEETVKDKWVAVASLLAQHVDELTTHKHLMKLSPAIEAYEAMEDAGALMSLFAYDDDELIGYSINFLSPHMHYSDVITCQNDVLYLNKEHRKGKVGLMMIRKTEQLAKERGVHLILMHAKPDTKLESLLPMLGYGVQETTFLKEI